MSLRAGKRRLPELGVVEETPRHHPEDAMGKPGVDRSARRNESNQGGLGDGSDLQVYHLGE